MANKNAYVVFLVDDDTKLLTMMKHYFTKNSEYNLEIHTFVDAEECVENLSLKPDVIVLDYYFDTADPKAQTGMDVMKRIKKVNDKVDIVMISGQDDMEVALECIRHGAFDYVIKNDNSVIRTHLTINKILEAKNKEYEVARYKKQMAMTVSFLIIFLAGMALTMAVYFLM